MSFLGEALGWIWMFVAGVGGIGLMIIEGPLPLTHGWFALASGLSLWPVTAQLLKRYAHVEPTWLQRFLVAMLFIIAGRIALKTGVWPITTPR